MKPPTPRQAQCLAILREGHALGCPPTLREIGQRMGIRSTNGVADLLRALEHRGLVEHRGSDSRLAWVPTGHHGLVARLGYLAAYADSLETPEAQAVAEGLRDFASWLSLGDASAPASAESGT